MSIADPLQEVFGLRERAEFALLDREEQDRIWLREMADRRLREVLDTPLPEMVEFDSDVRAVGFKIDGIILRVVEVIHVGDSSSNKMIEGIHESTEYQVQMFYASSWHFIDSLATLGQHLMFVRKHEETEAARRPQLNAGLKGGTL